MHRTIAGIALAATTLSLLVACGGNPAAPAPTVAPANAPAPTAAAAAPAEAAAASATQYPVTVENCGRTLTFERAPERVLVAYQPLAEILIALGLGDKIVGVQYGQAQEPLPEQAEAIGRVAFLAEPGTGTAAKEALIATDPDFVVVSYFSYDLDPSTGAASAADYQAAGAQVYGMATEAPCLPEGTEQGMATIYADIRNLGAIFGVPERAEALIAEQQARIAAVQERVAGRPAVRSIFYESGEGPYTIYGAGLASELLTLAGGENALADQPAYAQVGAEVIAASEAELWVITEYPSFEPVAQRAEQLFSTFPNLPAAQQRRSVGINGAEAGIGIRLPGVIETLARAMHPEAFGTTTEAVATTTVATPSRSYPVTVENCGRTLTFDKAPERVLTGYQNTVEIMIALGLQDRVVGRQPFSQSPLLPEQEAAFNAIPELAPGLPDGSASVAASREVQLAASPDFVLASAEFELNAARGVASIEDFAAAGAQVYILASGHDGATCSTSASKIELVYADIRNIGTIFGVEERAEALVAQMRAEIAEVQARIQGQTPVSMFAYDSGEGPLYAVSDLYFDFSLAGADNVIDSVDQAYPEVSLEAAAAADPEVIVTVNYNPGPIEEEAAQKEGFLRKVLQNSDAVANNRFVAIESIDTTPGIRNARAVRLLAQAFYPEVFK